jgi:hypothetical protein
MVIYRSLLGLAGLTAAVLIWFFLEGLADGTVSSFNIGLWLPLLAAVGGLFGGGIALHRGGRTVAGKMLLALLALPALLGGFVTLVLIISPPNWH